MFASVGRPTWKAFRGNFQSTGGARGRGRALYPDACGRYDLRRAGFEALWASNADDAVRILESRNDIRIVFTDINMPGSMDGIKLAHAVRGRWPPIKIIVTSGFSGGDLKLLPEGSQFIPKPYDADQISDALHNLAA